MLQLINPPQSYSIDSTRIFSYHVSISVVVDFGALVVSSVVMVSLGAYLFERVEAV